MDTILADAEAGLPSLLDHVERGVSVVITRHGKVVARIVPEVDGKTYDVRRAIAAIEAFRKTISNSKRPLPVTLQRPLVAGSR